MPVCVSRRRRTAFPYRIVEREALLWGQREADARVEEGRHREVVEAQPLGAERDPGAPVGLRNATQVFSCVGDGARESRRALESRQGAARLAARLSKESSESLPSSSSASFSCSASSASSA